MSSILMVDDNVALREALARSLTRRGCRVTTAASGVAGLEALRKQAFDVVVSEPLPDPASLTLFLETERCVLKPLSVETLWRQVEDVVRGASLVGALDPVECEPQPEHRGVEVA